VCQILTIDSGIYFLTAYFYWLILGVFAKLQKSTIRFFMYVCLFARLSAWNNSAPTERIFMKFYT